MPILPAEWEFMRPSQSCKMAEGSSSSCTPRERAVSLLRVVQNLLEESTEIYFGLSRWPVKSRSATCAEKERLWKLSKSRTSLSRSMVNNIVVNSITRHFFTHVREHLVTKNSENCRPLCSVDCFHSLQVSETLLKVEPFETKIYSVNSDNGGFQNAWRHNHLHSSLS